MSLKKIINEKSVIMGPGAYDAVSAQIIEREGFDIVYISGLANEASELGKPDFGFTTATEIVRRAANIVEAVNVPVICDADTGFGGSLNVWRTVREFERAGVSAIHIEDQAFPKRCGALPGKRVLPAEDFVKKIRVALDARKNSDFLIIARTDAKVQGGVKEVIRRANLYKEEGADMIMLGDCYTLKEYALITKEVNAPIVAGESAFPPVQPHFNIQQWEEVGIKIVFYWSLPLFAAMKAVTEAVRLLKTKGEIEEIKHRIFTYDEYGEIVKLPQWMKMSDENDK